MDNNQKAKKPFGLVLACKFANDALQQGVAPASVIIGNLFFLQTSNHFPKDLDVHFFSTPKRQLTDNEKRVMVQLLPSLKKPAFQIPEFLENAVKDNWVNKIPLPHSTAPKAKVSKPSYNKQAVAKAPKSPVAPPVVTIKKNKLT